MKITIDTKEDSHEDIRKIVSFLSTMTNDSNSIVESSRSSNIFELDGPSLNVFDSSENEEKLASNKFEDNGPAVSTVVETADEGSSTNAFANMFGDNSQSESSASNSEEIHQDGTSPDSFTNIFSDNDEESPTANPIQSQEEGPPLYNEEISEEEKSASKLVQEY
jgi:hypothetical protein